MSPQRARKPFGAGPGGSNNHLQLCDFRSHPYASMLMSLRFQIVLALVGIALLCSLSQGLYSYSVSRRIIEQDAVRAVGAAAEYHRQSLLKVVREQHERVDYMLRNAATPCKKGNRAECARRLTLFLTAVGAIGARFVLPGSQPISVGQEPKERQNNTPLAAGQLARFDWDEHGQPYYVVSQSLEGKTGTLILYFRTDKISRIFLDRYELGNSGESFLADSGGAFLTPPRYEHKSLQSHPIKARPMELCLSGKDSEVLDKDYRGVEVIHGFRYVPEIGGGCIMAHFDQAEAFAPAITLRNRMASYAAAFGFVAITLGVALAGVLAKPLRSLTALTQTLQSGNFGIAGRISGPTEVRRLAQSFDEMARSLEESEVALRNANLVLEQRVSERTSELAAANQELLDERARLQVSVGQIAELNARLAKENVYLEEQVRAEAGFEEIIGTSRALNKVLKQVETVAATESTVLIMGETGSGKELIARAIHRLSSRSNRPLIKSSCGAIPTSLLESELFGHEKGAFTGASTQKIGRLELAHGGTLFLDEVGELPLEVQPKLLRVLQDKEFERLGSNKTIHVDVRLVAATNRNLHQMVAEQRFRSDLYYRLNVFPIIVPPLRERPEDIPLLARHFVQKYALRMNKKIETIPVEALEALSNSEWPGNVRELENLIERSVILTPGSVLQVPLVELRPATSQTPVVGTLEAVEREHILRVLEETNGVIGGPNGAAARLGLKRTTLHAKMRKLGISREGA